MRNIRIVTDNRVVDSNKKNIYNRENLDKYNFIRHLKKQSHQLKQL